MLHTKFRGNRPAGSGEEDFLRFLRTRFMGMLRTRYVHVIWAWRPSWSCDLDHLYKLSFPFPRRHHIKFGFDWPSGFR